MQIAFAMQFINATVMDCINKFECQSHMGDKSIQAFYLVHGFLVPN